MSSPSKRTTIAHSLPQSVLAFRAIVSKTGCTSVGELLITRRISLVAVCCSSASLTCAWAAVRALFLSSSSVNNRTFSVAITA
jgi:hypothetical protein